MQIAIIGAGITGLATALVLIKKGFTCKVFEKASSLNEVGAGIWMQPNAMKILDFLGIGNTVRAAGIQLDQVEITNAKLIPLRKTDGKFVIDQNNNKITSIHRARLQKILFDALPTGTIELGREYKSHKAYNDKVTVEFSDGAIDAQILIGADGINSKVRKDMFDSELRFSGQTCWRGISSTELPKRFIANGKEMWGNNIRFGFANISSTEVYWFAVANAPFNEKENPLERQIILLNKYKSFHPIVKEIIGNTKSEKIIRNDISDLKRLNTWYQARVCLLGDAAHATTPNMGQGAGQGLEDAYYLGLYLSLSEPENAFRKFENARRKKVDYVVNNSWAFGKMAHSSLGRLGMKVIMKMTPEKVMLKQLQSLYSVDGLDEIPI